MSSERYEYTPNQLSPQGLNRSYTRRDFLLLSALGVAGSAVFGLSRTHPSPEKIFSPEITTAKDAAISAYAAMNDMRNDEGLFMENSHNDNVATNWTYSRVLAATSDMYRLTGDETILQALEQRVDGLSNYASLHTHSSLYQAEPILLHGKEDDTFFDDNAWVSLNLLRANKFIHEPWLINRTKHIFDAATQSYQDQQPGIFWMEQEVGVHNHDRNTVSNAPYIEIGAKLYQLTHDPRYLEWAQEINNFVDRTFYDPHTGLYNDHIDKQGKIEPTKWSYNQGTMVGAQILLSLALDDPQYMQKAEQLTKASLDYYAGDRLYKQSPKFNAIYFRNLLYLSAHTQDPQMKATITKSLSGYCDELLKHMDYSPVGLHVKSIHRHGIPLIEQASVVQLLALQATDPQEYTSIL